MSDPAPSVSWRGLLVGLSRHPPHYLVLVVLLAGLAWFVDREARHREAVYAPLLTVCLRVMEGSNR